MAEDSLEDVGGRINLKFAHPERWTELRNYCLTHDILIEREDYAELTLTIALAAFDAFPSSLRRGIRVFTAEEGAKLISAYQKRPIVIPRYWMPKIRETSEGGRTARQLIPDYLLPRE